MESQTEPSTPTFRFDWTVPVWQIVPAAVALVALIVYVNTIRNNVDWLLDEVTTLKQQSVEYGSLKGDIRVINNQVSRLERMLERLLERRASNGDMNLIEPGSGAADTDVLGPVDGKK